MIKLIAGLGNPDRKHEKDRHNVGFWFLSRFAAEQRVDLKPVAKYHGLVGKLARTQGDLWLLMPQTYMNLSGRSVGALARFYKILPRKCWPCTTSLISLRAWPNSSSGAASPGTTV